MIVFFGTSVRSAKFLDLATKNGLKFDLVVSEPPKPVGRKKVLTENPAVIIAKKFKLPFLLDLNDLSSHIQLQNPAAHFQSPTSKYPLGLILDFNQIIPPKIINLFKKGIVNIHFSKLPQYRGPAPVQATILNGDKEAWITYYLITQKLDEGPILKQTSLILDLAETTDSLYEKLIEKTAQEVGDVITDYLNGKINPRSQTGQPTITQKLTAENCRIDWTKSPVEIDHLIRAAYPEPGAWCFVKSPITNHKSQIKRLKILKAHLEKGKLVLDQVQLEGKNPVSWTQLKQGYPRVNVI